MHNQMRALGVEGCTGGWVAVGRNDAGQLQLLRRDALREFLLLTPAPAVIAVDVPIGLLPAGARVCDKIARSLLGPRRSSVFPAPLRPMLGSRTHAEASAIRRSIEGKGMSMQAFGILAKVTEVDELLNVQTHSREIVREVHPEVCFFLLNGNQPLAFTKKKAEGRRERLALLRSWCGSEADTLVAQRSNLSCKADDIIDALAGLWTAERILRGVALTLPAIPPRDALGIRMEMVG